MPFSRFDGICIATGALGLIAWTMAPTSGAAAALLGLGGVLHLARMARWRAAATWRSPLLAMLHVAYAFVPLGLVATAGAAAGWLAPAAGVHLWGIGAIGGMTVAVMMRATRGHTGRSLEAGPALASAFLLIALAALVRAALPTLNLGGIDGITVAAVLWTAGFVVIAGRMGLWLALPSPGRKRPNPAH